jgi:hypothetical protein
VEAGLADPVRRGARSRLGGAPEGVFRNPREGDIQHKGGQEQGGLSCDCGLSLSIIIHFFSHVCFLFQKVVRFSALYPSIPLSLNPCIRVLTAPLSPQPAFFTNISRSCIIHLFPRTLPPSARPVCQDGHRQRAPHPPQHTLGLRRCAFSICRPGDGQVPVRFGSSRFAPSPNGAPHEELSQDDPRRPNQVGALATIAVVVVVVVVVVV